MSTFLDNEKLFLLTLPPNEVGGRVISCFIRHRENNESIAWRRRTTISCQKYRSNS